MKRYKAFAHKTSRYQDDVSRIWDKDTRLSTLNTSLRAALNLSRPIVRLLSSNRSSFITIFRCDHQNLSRNIALYCVYRQDKVATL